LLRREERAHFEAIIEESTQRVGGYIMGNITISLFAGVTSFVALLVIGVPYAAALAFWVALTDLIPTVGAILGALVAVLVAAFAGVPELVATVIYFAIYQQVENYVIAPRVMRKAIEMSAAAVIVAVLIGGSLAGFIGALLALPAAAVIKIVVRQLYIEDRLEVVAAEGETPTA
jgi:predicted PurR-regulated permease PerM